MKITERFKETYSLPFDTLVPNYTKIYLDQKSLLLRFFKFFKRYAYMYLKKQISLEEKQIKSYHKKILWINISAPSLGDSLMDLSSRVLLKDRSVDLLTSKKNINLYKNDIFFENTYSNLTEVLNNIYDLVIVDSYSSRTLKIKNKLFPRLNYVSMFGFYNGPEVNRVLFSFYRMDFLLQNRLNTEQINSIAKTTISISLSDKNFVNKIDLPKAFISIVIGGEWEYRTYDKWLDIVNSLLEENKSLRIVLLGSKNAEIQSLEILRESNNKRIVNLVNQLTFNQTSEVISRSNAVLCCDGGLMHAAHAVNTPALVLLARLDSSMQTTTINRTLTLFDERNVKNIEFSEVLESYKKLSRLFDNHHLSG